MRFRCWAVVLLALSAQIRPLGAQSVRSDSIRQPPVSSRGRLAVTGCAGQPISEIVIITQIPFNERLPKRLEWMRRTARAVHTNTRDDVIRRFLLFKAGEPCNQIRRAESERILRAQPFLVDARIRAYDDERGGVRLEVETRDDFSLIFEPQIRTESPMFRGMRLGDANLGGSALLAALEWRDGGAFNDLLGVELTDYQFGTARNELRVVARRNLRGQEMRAEIVRPFYTDFQRFAWVGSAGGIREFQEFRRPGLPRNAVNVRREFANLGVLARVGPVGRLKLLGASVTREIERADSVPVVITPEGIQSDPGGALLAGFPGQRVVRVNALLGVRAIRFAAVQGFDALTGTQDVRVGAQLGIVAGQSIPIGVARDQDRFFSTNLYAGFGGPKSFVGLQAEGEARYDRAANGWDNLISSGRLAWYFRPAVQQTTILQMEWAVGRQMRVPFQLTFGDRDGGLIGHRNSREPGAQRLVVRGEQRLVIPTRYNVGDAGLAAFAEAGRMRADPSVPYSMSTPWRGAVGVSVLAAVPPKSRRLWRVDFGLPVGGDPDRMFEVRFSSVDRSRVFWREPNDVRISRERTAPSSLFIWP